jgi:hypothetical protein
LVLSLKHDCVEKKLSLSKLQSSIWEKTNSVSNSDNFTISDIDMDDDIIKNLLDKDTDTSKGSYKLK